MGPDHHLSELLQEPGLRQCRNCEVGNRFVEHPGQRIEERLNAPIVDCRGVIQVIQEEESRHYYLFARVQDLAFATDLYTYGRNQHRAKTVPRRRLHFSG